MLHGSAKQREIARSVLPSTHRRGAKKALDATRRQARRVTRAELASLSRAPDADGVVDRWDYSSTDPRAWPSSDITDIVWIRRDGDKLGALFRWGRATTSHLPLEDRLNAVKAMFGDNLIGRHAVGHLESDDHFRIGYEHDHWWRERYLGRRVRVDRTPALRMAAIDALAIGMHAEFNRWMKRHPDKDGRARVLGGWHDVDAFARDCAGTVAWADAVDRFARADRASTNA